MLPDGWFDYVFPAQLRADRRWIESFAPTRRTYVLNYFNAAYALDRQRPKEVRENLRPHFREDPRRYIPLTDWRSPFRHHGEVFLGTERYAVPPPDPKHAACSRWGQFGKKQLEHAWVRRPMRLYDALKCVAALHDAEDQLAREFVLPSQDGQAHQAHELSLHVAIFRLSRFDLDYYERHFASSPELLLELYEDCDLAPGREGERTNTFFEMASGLSATARTCQNIQAFCSKKGLPSVGNLQMDISARGKNREMRKRIKSLRQGIFRKFSPDCAVELFSD